MKKFFIWTLILALIFTSSFILRGNNSLAEDFVVLDPDEKLKLGISATSSITIMNPSGKKAIIDFSGDEVTYSGDLEVSEAAKIFFDYVFKYYQGCYPKKGGN